MKKGNTGTLGRGLLLWAPAVPSSWGHSHLELSGPKANKLEYLPSKVSIISYRLFSRSVNTLVFEPT